MTIIALLRGAQRAWHLVLLGCLSTGLFAAHVASADGVYWVQVDVVFLRPVNAAVPNSLGTTSDSVIATAGVVQRKVVGGPDSAHVVSNGVTIVQEGIRSGESVRLPNAGGQWANNFNRAMLDVQVVDATAEKVQARLDAVLARIDTALHELQQHARVGPAHAIRTRLNPAIITIRHDAGNPPRAVAMTVILGMSMTIAALVLRERRDVQVRRKGKGWRRRRLGRKQLANENSRGY